MYVCLYTLYVRTYLARYGVCVDQSVGGTLPGPCRAAGLQVVLPINMNSIRGVGSQVPSCFLVRRRLRGARAHSVVMAPTDRLGGCPVVTPAAAAPAAMTPPSCAAASVVNAGASAAAAAAAVRALAAWVACDTVRRYCFLKWLRCRRNARRYSAICLACSMAAGRPHARADRSAPRAWFTTPCMRRY
jgi:hypothetical protein